MEIVQQAAVIAAALVMGTVSAAEAGDFVSVPYVIEKSVAQRDRAEECLNDNLCYAACETAASYFGYPGACATARQAYASRGALMSQKSVLESEEDWKFYLTAPSGYKACSVDVWNPSDGDRFGQQLSEIGAYAWYVQIHSDPNLAWEVFLRTKAQSHGKSSIKATLIFHYVREGLYDSAVAQGVCRPDGRYLVDRSNGTSIAH